MSTLDKDTELMIYQAFLRLSADCFPAAPFQLNPWTQINDDRWFAIVRSEVAVAVAYLEGQQPRPAPRQQTGALLAMLRHLEPLIRKPSVADDIESQPLAPVAPVRGVKDRLPNWYQRPVMEPNLPSVEAWRLTGLSYYQQLRDRIAGFLAHDPNATEGLMAMRQHMVTHLDGLCHQLQGGTLS